MCFIIFVILLHLCSCANGMLGASHKMETRVNENIIVSCPIHHKDCAAAQPRCLSSDAPFLYNVDAFGSQCDSHLLMHGLKWGKVANVREHIQVHIQLCSLRVVEFF
jgi:hypothetical protein